MRYFIIVLYIACLDLEKENETRYSAGTEEDENGNISENVNSILVSMTHTEHMFTEWNTSLEHLENLDSSDCTFQYSNDDDALDIDCEICDVYGFMVYEGYTEGSTGDCVEANILMHEDKEVGYGINFETSEMFYLSGASWLDGRGDCEVTQNSATCISLYSTEWQPGVWMFRAVTTYSYEW